MTPRTRRFLAGPLLPLSALAAAFLLSLAAYALLRPPVEGRIFFYPDNSGQRIGTERRGIPARRSLEGRIRVFLEELFLGPSVLEWTDAVPRGTDVRHVAVVGKTAYIDLGRRMLDADAELPVAFDASLAILERNIAYNFPRIEEIVFTIEGRQVGAPYFSGIDGSE